MKRESIVLSVCLVLTACGGADSGGADDAAGPEGTGGGGGAGGSGKPGLSATRVGACDQLCKRGVDACVVDRAACQSDCEELLAISKCERLVDTFLACQQIAKGACAGGEFVVEGCDDEASAVIECTVGAGGAGGKGGAGSGGAGGQDAGAIPSSEAIDMIVASCATCCPTGNECADPCRVAGARNLACVSQYLSFMRCVSTTGQCSFTRGCDTERDALRVCATPEPRGEQLGCKETCNTRTQAACVREPAPDVCLQTCEVAETKPDCASVIDQYTKCEAASHDFCLPNGSLSTECKEESAALQECADLGGMPR